MYMTPRHSWRTVRRDEGRWWRTPTRHLQGHAPLFSPPPHTFDCIIIGWLMYHGNSLWPQEAGGSKRKCDVNAVLLRSLHWCSLSETKWNSGPEVQVKAQSSAFASRPLYLPLCFLKHREHPFMLSLNTTTILSKATPAPLENRHTPPASTGPSPSAPPPSYKQLIFCSSAALMDALRLEASEPRDIHLLARHTPAWQKIFVMCTPIFLQ